ncbi:hypothetical protein [Arhodomonas sp. AD133]|uniref:hypothetical protein n=1 Tax=Arhodomonas sp. AD133 TaxID=3415009 RepID=UPI003EBE81CD
MAALLALPTVAPAEPTTLPLDDQPVSRSYPHAPRIEQVVELDGFGRYAFEATGEQPVRVQLVGRMAGPGPIRPGRTDRFLDRGEAKVVLHGQDDGSGDIELTARPFREQNGEDLPRLPEQRLVETELRDYQRRSYWIEVDEPRTISVEAGGRYLADLRLWRDGRWLEAAEPTAEVREPVTGQPLEVRRIHARLTPGLYRLTAYGGPDNPWSTESDAAPLYLRKGIPELPAEGWSVLRASPLGIDRYRLDSSANVFQLELPEAESASLRVSPYNERSSPYQVRNGRTGRIDKDARDPQTTVRTGDAGPNRSRDLLVTVERTPGAEYRLAYLRHARRYAVPGNSNSAWVSTVTLGDPRDAIDATAIIVHDPPGKRPEVKAARAIELSSSKAWRRRFNLLETVDLLVEIQEEGTYVADVGSDSEANVELQVEPLDRTAARNFRTRWDVASEARWDLVKGFYRISMRPRHGDAGIAEISLHHTAAPPDSLGAPMLAPRQASAVFDGIALSRHDYVLANRYSQGRSGLTVRPWPLRLDRPLPVTQSAGSTRRFQVDVDQSRRIIAETPAGERLPLSASEGGPTQESIKVDGQSPVFVTNDGAEPIRYLLRWAPKPQTPPPPLNVVDDAEIERRLPDFPVIEPGRPAHLKLSRQQQATYRLAVQTPALYRLESTGLLSTTGRLRTRAIATLATANGNGVGRNFLIQRYLGSGDYQLTVNANGRSAGPLGVSLKRTPVREAAAVPLDGAVRTTVQPGDAVRYQLDIAEAGKYRLRALGLKQPFDIQLTGPDGWPVIRPGRRTPITLNLRPGEHTLTVLPQSVAARAVTTLERIDTSPARLEGHGPHELPLNRTRRHTWMEPDDETAPRTPDRWHFDLAATMHVRLDLPTEMNAALLRRERGSWQPADANIAAAREGWLELGAGAYRLEVRSRRPNNRVDYHVRVATRELPLGQSRRVSVPGKIPFVLDSARLVKISSLGGEDVAATLLNGAGERLAFNDDRPDDWNFLISRQLPPGRYTMAVTAPDSDGHTTVALDAPEEITEHATAPDAELTVTDGDVHIYPLDLSEVGDVPRSGLPLLFISRAAGTHGVALERREGDTWRTVTTRTGRNVRGGVVLTTDDIGQDHRLRVWALDTVLDGIHVALRLGERQASPRKLPDTLNWELAPLAGADANLGLAVLQRPGPLHTETRREGLLWASPGGAFMPAREGWMPARDRAVWALAPPGPEALETEVVSLKPGTSRTIPAPAHHALPLPTQAGDIDQLRLWMASSTAHTPELRPRASGGAAATSDTRTAVTVALPRTDLGDSGLVLGLVDATGDAPVTVSAHALETAEPVVAEPGSSQLALPAGTATKVTGPTGAADIALTASAGVAGILVADGAIDRILWTGDRARKMHTRTTADALWLANPGDHTETISLTWHPVERSRQLTPGRFEPYTPTFGGTLSLPVRAPAEFEGRAHVAGAVQAVRFIADDGRSSPSLEGAESLAISGPGVLQITHADAPFGVWLADSDGTVAGWRHTETLALDAPALLSLRGNRPTLIALDRPSGGTERRWLDAVDGIDTVLPAGETRLRAMGTPPTKRLVTPTAMPAGLGDPVRLGSGEARAFTFALEQARTVGLGLKADREVIHAVLVDERGQHVGEGIAQMHRLEPGRYYLIAHLPRDESPALVQPALVGTQLPDDGPPARVRERYRQLAGKE